MPNYILTPDELDLVHKAVSKYQPRGFDRVHEYPAFIADRRRWEPDPLPIGKLLRDFGLMAEGNWPQDAAAWPEGIDRLAIPPALLGEPQALTLALALAILRPHWNKVEAHLEYLWMRSRLLAAWGVQEHTESQKRSKIFGEVVAFGAQQGAGWPLANDVLYFYVLGACLLSSMFLEGPPLGRGLIPDLTAAWGTDFREEVPLHAAAIRYWLVQPSGRLPFVGGSFWEFTVGPDGCLVPLSTVPPGSKRNFILSKGAARLVDHNGVLVGAVPTGQHLMLGSRDEGEAHIRIAHLHGPPGAQYVAGPELRISHHAPCGRLIFDADSELETWTCTCGLFNCDKKHRLSSWDPAVVPPNASLKTFLWTAVKGPGGGRTVLLGNFVRSMYYAFLCEGAA